MPRPLSSAAITTMLLVFVSLPDTPFSWPPTQIGLVDFDTHAETVPARSDHGAAQYVYDYLTPCVGYLGSRGAVLPMTLTTGRAKVRTVPTTLNAQQMCVPP